MKVKFTGWSGDSFDSPDQTVYTKTNEWLFEVDGKSYNWSIREEQYFDGEDEKGKGYYVYDNITDELLMDSTWDDQMQKCNDFKKADWINDLSGFAALRNDYELPVALNFILKVNEFFENSDCGTNLFDFRDLGDDRVIGQGEFEIN